MGRGEANFDEALLYRLPLYSVACLRAEIPRSTSALGSFCLTKACSACLRDINLGACPVDFDLTSRPPSFFPITTDI